MTERWEETQWWSLCLAMSSRSLMRWLVPWQSSAATTVDTIAVRKERSVCTVTSVATDDTAIACALGSSGKVELWDRRESRRVHKLASRIAVLLYRTAFHG